MSFHRQEMGSRPVLDLQVSSVTSSKGIELFAPFHLFHTCFSRVVSPKCCSRRFINVISITNVYIRISEMCFLQFVAYVTSRYHVCIAVWFQRSFSSMYHSHVHISLSRTAPSSSSSHGCLWCFQLTLTCAFRGVCFALTRCRNGPILGWRVRFACSGCPRAVSQA